MFRYVSIRHGGQDIGAGNEINGLTMGAVGSGTTIDHIEVVYNADDGYEWFGGTVNTSHLIAAYFGDDAFDYDQGFLGQHQFWYCLSGPNTEGNGGEHDGGTDPEDGTPYSMPIIFNATYVATPSLDSKLIDLRDNAGGKYFNSIFKGFAEGLQIENRSSGEDSYNRFVARDIEFVANFWHDIGGDTALAFVYDDDGNVIASETTELFNYLTGAEGMNTVEDVISAWAGSSYDPRPAGSATSGAGMESEYSNIEDVDYYGAFAPTGTTWASGWTYISGAGLHVD